MTKAELAVKNAEELVNLQSTIRTATRKRQAARATCDGTTGISTEQNYTMRYERG